MDSAPNVLFLVVDSLRRDVLSRESALTVPTMQSLRDEGVDFERCYAQGISTAPSMTAMLTGRYPLDYGGHWYLPADQPTLAGQFRENGYRTAAIHSNPNVSRLRNFDQGFDVFEEHILPIPSDRLPNALPGPAIKLLNKLARILSRTPYVPADEVNDEILEWIDGTDPPWFCWTQYMDTHGPYLPGDDVSYRRKFRAERLWRKAAVRAPEAITADEHDELRRNYRLEVEYLDAALGRFFARLEARGHLEDTIVVLVGDHGDEFAEHGLYGHKNLPYEELVRVPALVRWPNGVAVDAPDRVTTPVRAMDLLPTILDVVGADLSAEMTVRMEAESLQPVFRGAEPTYDVIVTEKEMRNEDALRFGFRDERYTYLYDGLDESEYLYDREADPDEKTNVLGTHPDVAERFRSTLADRLASIEATATADDREDVEETAAVEERLRALGYRE